MNASENPGPDELRRAAQQNYVAGNVLDAINTQVRLVNELKDAPEFPVDDFRRLAMYLFSFRDHTAATAILEQAREQVPDHFDVLSDLGCNLVLLRRYDEAIEVLMQARRINKDDANLHDALAHAYGLSGNHPRAVKCGEISLLLKAKAYDRKSPYPLPSKSAPEFDPSDPSRNIIAFSLWGKSRRYIDGALANATHAQVIYPAWTCRFYCDDTVPGAVRQGLQDLGAQVQMMESQKSLFEGLFWRFLVMDDPSVSHFLVRDCDSVISVKERVAVDQWLQSGKWFHLMRDWYSHTDLVMAGMWGGVRGVIPSIQDLINEFRSENIRTRTLDQEFLRQAVWPVVRESNMTHDRFFKVLGARKFSTIGELPPGEHIGQNVAAVRSGEREQD